jgi:predicted PurR-regulated permease PerM
LIALPIAAVVTTLIVDAIELVQRLFESEQGRAVFIKLAQGDDTTPPTRDPEAPGAMDLLLSQGNRAWAIATQLAGAAAAFVIGMLIMVTGMYGVLVYGTDWWTWSERHAVVSPVHLRRLGDAFLETGRGLWYGIIGAGLIQSIVATTAYLVLGVPSALPLGMLTLLFSVVPAIGTALVWVPVAAGLALTGRTGAAIALAVIGVAVIGTVDNVARPYLARKGKLQLPTWIVLLSMFGGVKLLGGWGLLMGPLVLRLAKEALVISRESRDPATSSPPVETTDGT